MVFTVTVTVTVRAFSRRLYPKRLTSVNTHIDTPTAESTMQGDSQLVRSSFRVKCLAQGHINPQLGGADLLVARQLLYLLS